MSKNLEPEEPISHSPGLVVYEAIDGYVKDKTNKIKRTTLKITPILIALAALVAVLLTRKRN
ncbi:hypothetical protein [Gardnerella vaginalis]|uniref:hypothetical protein n=1 Tax=Gardnerella vaginalis TaxID=2702 RepID=UPI003970A5B6